VTEPIRCAGPESRYRSYRPWRGRVRR
jgi:hypothetical protein